MQPGWRELCTPRRVLEKGRHLGPRADQRARGPTRKDRARGTAGRANRVGVAARGPAGLRVQDRQQLDRRRVRAGVRSDAQVPGAEPVVRGDDAEFEGEWVDGWGKGYD